MSLDEWLRQLTGGMPPGAEILRTTVRLLTAALVGAIIGVQREHSGKSAGLRTHVLVSLGCAVFVLLMGPAGSNAEVSRVVQGIASGIGFIGAGAILKLSSRERVKGLTTASGIWITAALGTAAGIGRIGIALSVAVLAWAVLAILGRFEAKDRGHTIE
jgi:putative Mg2+ transporter-C (MgtC) family protein